MLPGGFSFGDYLRSGAIAARSPVMREVVRRAQDGVLVLESATASRRSARRVLPGALMRNASLKFVCREVKLEVVNTQTPYARLPAAPGDPLPVAHHDGNYFAHEATLDDWRRKAASSSAMPRARNPTARGATSPAS